MGSRFQEKDTGFLASIPIYTRKGTIVIAQNDRIG